jgi:hypothetical protein
MEPPDGTSILDVSDPSNPRVKSTITPPKGNHTHKVRVSGDIMVINNENHRRHQKRAGGKIPAERARLEGELGRPPTDDELAAALTFKAADLPILEEAAAEGYDSGGLRVFDISNPEKPRELSYFKTGGEGVHRFDFDGEYAYISTQLDDYQDGIVMIVDLRDPANPKEVSRWWVPGQWTGGGEKPDWGELRYECHHPLRFGDRLYVGYHAAGAVILDINDITKPRLVSRYNYHPLFVSSSHTYTRMPFPLGGRDIALVVDEQPGRARPGLMPAFFWVFDVTDETDPKPIATHSMSEEDTPWRRALLKNGRTARFGAHQPHERMTDSLAYITWFRGGLRIVDIADPTKPRDVGHFIPVPAKGQPTVQSNDVFVDDRGLIYLIDRLNGLDILERTGPPGQKSA